MTLTWTAAVAGFVGLFVGAAGVLGFRVSERERMRLAQPSEPELPPGVSEVLAVLRSAVVVVDLADGVAKASPAAYAFGLVRGHDLVHAELRELVADARRFGLVQERELELPRGPFGRARLVVHARVAPLGADHVLILVDDRTEARRVEEVRRDFVANVSHELKTPIGALHLLAEAVHDAADDPDAVRHFAERMERESRRLTSLVQEIIDLSRLQVADALHSPEPVGLDEVVSEAVDRCRLVAQAKHIDVVIGGDAGAIVYGDHSLLVTAVRNLVDNAIAYSPEHTRVGIGVRRGQGVAEVAVRDQGIGISLADQSRIFERFYRVDPARSRATGGTGLGLSIVKHVVANHGGEVTVWSMPGQGSTFTLRLPDSARPDGLAAGSEGIAVGPDGFVAGPDGIALGPGGFVPGSDGLAAGSDGLAAGSGGFVPGSDGLAAGSDGLAAGSGGFVPGSDGLAAGTDGLAAGSDGLAAGSDGLAAGSDGLAAGPEDTSARPAAPLARAGQDEPVDTVAVGPCTGTGILPPKAGALPGVTGPQDDVAGRGAAGREPQRPVCLTQPAGAIRHLPTNPRGAAP